QDAKPAGQGNSPATPASNGANGTSNGKMQPNPTLQRAARSGLPTEDERLLKRVEPSRQAATDFTQTDPWRVMRIMGEFVQGFEALAHIGPAVTIFGSARVSPTAPEYKAAVLTAQKLAEAGFAIITGGGPGIMEAANKGARLGRGQSIGC